MKTRDIPLIDTFCKRAVQMALCLGALSLQAQTSTWDGGSATTDNWTDGANWGGAAPTAGDVLEFDGASRLTPANDFTAGTGFGGLSFLLGADPFVLSGNAISLSGNVNSSAPGTQTVNPDIALTNSILITITANDASSRITFNGDISGAHGLTLSGTEQFSNNRVTFTGNNTYSGGTTAGAKVTAWITNPNSLPGNVVVEDEGALRLRPTVSGSVFTNNITIAGRGAEMMGRPSWMSRDYSGALVINNNADVAGTVTLAGNSTISAGRDDTGTSGTSGTISGRITGNYDLRIGFVGGNPGTLTLTNPANDWIGDTLVTGGAQTNASGRVFTLRLGADNVLPSGDGFGNLTINTNNSRVDSLGTDQSINGLFANNTQALYIGGGTLTVGNGNADGNYQGILTVNGLVKTGTGTQIFRGETDVSTATAVDEGVLQVTGGYLAGGAISVADGATLQLDGGELRYTSATAMDLNNTGTFSFTSGTLTGTNWEGGLSGLTIGSGQTVAPGTSPGAASTGSQTWAGGGTYQFEINDAEGTSGSNWDHLTVTGDLDISGLSSADPFIIDLMSLTAGNNAGEADNFTDSAVYEWEFVSFANLIGTFSSDLFLVDTANFQNTFNQDFEVNQSGNTLVVSAIPEPSSLILLLIAGVGLTGLRNRRVKRG